MNHMHRWNVVGIAMAVLSAVGTAQAQWHTMQPLIPDVFRSTSLHVHGLARELDALNGMTLREWAVFADAYDEYLTELEVLVPRLRDFDSAFSAQYFQNWPPIKPREVRAAQSRLTGELRALEDALLMKVSDEAGAALRARITSLQRRLYRARHLPTMRMDQGGVPDLVELADYWSSDPPSGDAARLLETWEVEIDRILRAWEAARHAAYDAWQQTLAQAGIPEPTHPQSAANAAWRRDHGAAALDAWHRAGRPAQHHLIAAIRLTHQTLDALHDALDPDPDPALMRRLRHHAGASFLIRMGEDPVGLAVARIESILAKLDHDRGAFEQSAEAIEERIALWDLDDRRYLDALVEARLRDRHLQWPFGREGRSESAAQEMDRRWNARAAHARALLNDLSAEHIGDPGPLPVRPRPQMRRLLPSRDGLWKPAVPLPAVPEFGTLDSVPPPMDAWRENEIAESLGAEAARLIGLEEMFASLHEIRASADREASAWNPMFGRFPIRGTRDELIAARRAALLPLHRAVMESEQRLLTELAGAMPIAADPLRLELVIASRRAELGRSPGTIDRMPGDAPPMRWSRPAYFDPAPMLEPIALLYALRPKPALLREIAARVADLLPDYVAARTAWFTDIEQAMEHLEATRLFLWSPATQSGEPDPIWADALRWRRRLDQHHDFHLPGLRHHSGAVADRIEAHLIGPDLDAWRRARRAREFPEVRQMMPAGLEELQRRAMNERQPAAAAILLRHLERAETDDEHLAEALSAIISAHRRVDPDDALIVRSQALRVRRKEHAELHLVRAMIAVREAAATHER